MVTWSHRHEDFYAAMIAEMLQYAVLTEAERTRLVELSARDALGPEEASGVDGLYQVYLDQSVME